MRDGSLDHRLMLSASVTIGCTPSSSFIPSRSSRWRPRGEPCPAHERFGADYVLDHPNQLPDRHRLASSHVEDVRLLASGLKSFDRIGDVNQVDADASSLGTLSSSPARTFSISVGTSIPFRPGP